MAEQILHDSGRLTNRQGYWLFAVGRLKPEVHALRAGSDMNMLALLIEQEHPDTNKNLGASLFPATLVPGPYRGYVSAFTGLLMAVFGLVLVIACVNAATLLLARATGRAREMAIRSALGAGRGRLIRQMLVESTLLSGLAGCLGLALAYGTSPLLLALKPATLPITLRVHSTGECSFSHRWFHFLQESFLGSLQRYAVQSFRWPRFLRTKRSQSVIASHGYAAFL